MRRQPLIPSDALVREYEGAQLPDLRLRRRLVRIAASLEGQADLSFPQALDDAGLEAVYRFVGNERVDFEAVLGPHEKETRKRAEAHEVVLAVHDTSQFRFTGDVEREGLGLVKSSGWGFFGHFSMAVTADDKREPLGVLAAELWARDASQTSVSAKRKTHSYSATVGESTEQDRWWRSICRVEEQAADGVDYIHVMDREGDDYKLYARLIESDVRFVTRLARDRVLDPELTGSAPKERTKEYVSKAQVGDERQVKLSRRSNKRSGGYKRVHRARKERTAKLGISATRVAFRRPHYLKELPEALEVNLVYVREIDAPEGVQPVEWHLVTTEPIGTRQQILKVVDYYRGRWRIEEFFKALKTGCSFEQRQLESLHALSNALAIFTPMAWQLLRLRSLARSTPKAPASRALTRTQITVLRRFSPKRLPPKLSVERALQAVADLGGHQRQNGPPGWQILGRGLQQLLTLERGFQSGRKAKAINC